MSTVKQLIKFGIVGISNTVVYSLIYYPMTYFGVHYALANTAAFVISVLNSYFWNSKFVFGGSGNKHLKAIFKTYIVYGSTFLLGMLFMYISIDVMGVSKYIAPVLNLVVTIPLNFLLNKYFVFKS